MFIDSKIITNFTTPSTRSFNISYNLTLLEASIETINNMKNLNDKVEPDFNMDNNNINDLLSNYVKI